MYFFTLMSGYYTSIPVVLGCIALVLRYSFIPWNSVLDDFCHSGLKSANASTSSPSTLAFRTRTEAKKDSTSLTDGFIAGPTLKLSSRRAHSGSLTDTIDSNVRGIVDEENICSEENIASRELASRRSRTMTANKFWNQTFESYWSSSSDGRGDESLNISFRCFNLAL